VSDSAVDDSNEAIGRWYVLAAALMWSAGGVVTKLLLAPGLGPLPIAFYRSLFAGLVLLPLVRPAHWIFRPVMVPCALVFGAMVGLYIGAISATTAANAIFLQCTATFWTVPMSALILRERPERRSVAGIALASVGIVAIVLFGYVGKPGEGAGIAMGLGAGIGYAAAVIGLRGLRDLNPIWLSAFNNLAGALTLGAWMIAWAGPIPIPAPRTALALIAFGTFQMAIPYVFFARGLRAVSAPDAALIALLEPVLNPLWVALFYHEFPAPATIVGGLFLLAGVACRYWPKRLTLLKKSRKEHSPLVLRTRSSWWPKTRSDDYH
jgi:drug/metabolite transporter (DMT)-like permease